MAEVWHAAHTWSSGMNLIVCLVLATALWEEVNADISWSHGHSPISIALHGHSDPAYDARKAHDQAKYYARKAHDLAKLQSSSYGIGHSLYGFRYGSHFPSQFSKPFPLLPFIDKYPLFDLGLNVYPYSSYSSHHSPSFHQSPLLSGISGHLTGFGYPNSHSNAYSRSYSYGKGYSYGNKKSYGISKPYSYGYSNIKASPLLNSGYIKKFPGEKIVYESHEEPHGYQYAYVKESPKYHNVGGYDSIRGIRYNGNGYTPIYKKFPEETIIHSSHLPSSNYHLSPSSEIALSDGYGGHGGDSYIPILVSGYENGDEFSPEIDSHSLIDHGADIHKFDSSDLIAYGSEESQVKKAEE